MKLVGTLLFWGRRFGAVVMKRAVFQYFMICAKISGAKTVAEKCSATSLANAESIYT